MPYREDTKVGLLIGANCTHAIKPTEVIPGREDDPYLDGVSSAWITQSRTKMTVIVPVTVLPLWKLILAMGKDVSLRLQHKGKGNISACWSDENVWDGLSRSKQRWPSPFPGSSLRKPEKEFMGETMDTRSYHFHKEMKEWCFLTIKTWPLAESRSWREDLSTTQHIRRLLRIHESNHWEGLRRTHSTRWTVSW